MANDGKEWMGIGEYNCFCWVRGDWRGREWYFLDLQNLDWHRPSKFPTSRPQSFIYLLKWIDMRRLIRDVELLVVERLASRIRRYLHTFHCALEQFHHQVILACCSRSSQNYQRFLASIQPKKRFERERKRYIPSHQETFQELPSCSTDLQCAGIWAQVSDHR